MHKRAAGHLGQPRSGRAPQGRGRLAGKRLARSPRREDDRPAYAIWRSAPARLDVSARRSVVSSRNHLPSRGQKTGDFRAILGRQSRASGAQSTENGSLAQAGPSPARRDGKTRGAAGPCGNADARGNVAPESSPYAHMPRAPRQASTRELKKADSADHSGSFTWCQIEYAGYCRPYEDGQCIDGYAAREAGDSEQPPLSRKPASKPVRPRSFWKEHVADALRPGAP